MTRTIPLLALLALAGCGKSAQDSSTTTTPTGSSTGSATGTATGTATGSATGTSTGSTTTTPCDITEVPPVTGDPLTVPLAGQCPLDTRYGGFTVGQFELFSTVEGKVSDGVVPVTILTLVQAEGTCELLRRENLFCDPPCAGDETCDFDGSCIPFPEPQNVGRVTVGGLLQDVLMSPIQPGNTYFDTSLPHPAMTPGELIEMRTGCMTWDQVELHGVAVEELQLTTPDWVVRQGQPLHFEWVPPSVPINPGQHIQVRLNIDQHGASPIQMFCEFPDTGSADLPATLVDAMLNAGVTGFPNATVTRRTVDSTTLSDGTGCIEFTVKSPVEPNVSVEGYIPCYTDLECPTGMSCNQLIGLCE